MQILELIGLIFEDHEKYPTTSKLADT